VEAAVGVAAVERAVAVVVRPTRARLRCRGPGGAAVDFAPRDARAHPGGAADAEPARGGLRGVLLVDETVAVVVEAIADGVVGAGGDVGQAQGDARLAGGGAGGAHALLAGYAGLRGEVVVGGTVAVGVDAVADGVARGGPGERVAAVHDDSGHAARGADVARADAHAAGCGLGLEVLVGLSVAVVVDSVAEIGAGAAEVEGDVQQRRALGTIAVVGLGNAGAAAREE
jgi:hypothetical protein